MKSLLIVLGWIVLLAAPALAQNSAENLLESVELHFSMPAEPSPEKVGFDNPKSFWKLQYELVLSDSFVLEKIGRCNRTPEYRLNCHLNYDKKLTRKMRKGTIPLAKGAFVKRGPMSESDREIVIPVRLSPEVIDIFNKSVGNDGVNPTFLLFVKTKASTRTADKAKFKKKLTTEGIHPLKFYFSNKKFSDYWNVKRLGLSLGLTRGEDGTIRGFHIFRF